VLNQAADPFGIIGQVLDSQFRVDRLVGEGGFSAVYRGHHLGLDEPIAIKCLKLPPSLSRALVDQFVKRFRDESRILYRLSQGNLNIVRSIAGGTWQSPVGVLVPFMVLEWMDGRSLANEFTIRRTVGKQGRSLDEVLNVFESAADGIAYAHAQGVIHRDLNPGNFFFTNSPQGQRLKVLDFGVAKILDDSTLNIERMQTVGQIRIFAPAYGSPEQFDDSLGKVGAASDVYAFALILLEALRDRPVNDGTHLGEFAQRAIDPNQRPTPRALGIDVPDEVESIFARATRLQPRERWQSVAEFWNSLTNAVSAAKEQRYARAATETPSLGMPQPASRSTKTGMAPPAQQGKLPMKRMDKTVPVGAVLPPVPGRAPSPPRPASPGSTSRVEAARPPPPPVPAETRDADGAFQEEATKVGVVVADIPTFGEEGDGDEVTRINAPAPDVLAHMVDAGPRPGPGAGTMANVSNQNQPPPRPAAGQAPDAQSQPGFPAAQPHPPGRPPMAGTLMMNQGGAGFGPLPPPPQRAHQPPMQPPMHQPPPQQAQMPAGPPPGYPPPQMQQQPPMHQQPPMQPQMPPPNYQQAPPQIHQQPHQAPSVPQGGSSLAPDGVPKKSNAMLILGIVGGLIVLGGVGALVVIVASGSPKAGQATSASVSAVAPPAPMPAPEPVAAPTPAPTPEQPATPTPTEEADKGAVAANPATPDTPAPAPQPAPQPVVNNGGGGGWQPAPAPQPAKSAAPPVDPDAFNESAARSTLSGAAVAFCKKEGGVSGPGSATVTFNPDGSVASVAMDAPYAGTPTGDCVKGLFQRSKTKPWKGSPQSVKTSFDVPK
jgi:serine/threonine protein kinase